MYQHFVGEVSLQFKLQQRVPTYKNVTEVNNLLGCTSNIVCRHTLIRTISNVFVWGIHSWNMSTNFGNIVYKMCVSCCFQFRPATPDVRNGTVTDETAASCDATPDNKDGDDDSAVRTRPPGIMWTWNSYNLVLWTPLSLTRNELHI